MESERVHAVSQRGWREETKHDNRHLQDGDPFEEGPPTQGIGDHMNGGGAGASVDEGPEIMLGFKHLGLSTVDPPRNILSNVTGFVVKGECLVCTLLYLS